MEITSGKVAASMKEEPVYFYRGEGIGKVLHRAVCWINPFIDVGRSWRVEGAVAHHPPRPNLMFFWLLLSAEERDEIGRGLIDRCDVSFFRFINEDIYDFKDLLDRLGKVRRFLAEAFWF